MLIEKIKLSRFMLLSFVVIFSVIVSVNHIFAQESGEIERLSAKVEQLYGEGKYDEAIELAQKLLFLYKEANGPTHVTIGHTLMDLGILYQNQRLYRKAEQVFKESIENFTINFGKNSLQVTQCRFHLANLYYDQSNYNEAEDHYKKILSVLLKNNIINHPHFKSSLTNLETIYKTQKKIEEANKIERRLRNLSTILSEIDYVIKNEKDPAVAITKFRQQYDERLKTYKYEEAIYYVNTIRLIVKDVLGETDLLYASLSSQVANCFYLTDDYDESEEFYLNALNIYEQSNDSKPSEITDCLTVLCNIYRIKGDITKAEEMAKRAIEIDKKDVGVFHENTASDYNSLAMIYAYQGKINEAEEMFKQSIDIFKKLNLTNDISYASILSNLAEIYEAQKNYVKANLFFKEAVSIYEKNNKTNDPNYVLVRYKYDNLFKKNIGKSHSTILNISNLDSAITSLTKLLESDSERADYWCTLAQTYNDKETYDSAAVACKKALELDNWNTEAFYTLGVIFYNLKKLDESISAFKKAIASDLKCCKSYTFLGHVYSTKENLEEGHKYYMKAIDCDSTNSTSWLDLGNSYLLQEDIENAILSFEKSLALDENNQRALFNLAGQYWQKGLKNKAYNCFKKCRNINENSLEGKLANELINNFFNEK